MNRDVLRASLHYCFNHTYTIRQQLDKLKPQEWPVEMEQDLFNLIMDFKQSEETLLKLLKMVINRE